MEPVIAAIIKQLLSQGQTEEGLTRLVAWFDANPSFSELAQVVRVNQADFFQLKSQILRGTISTDEARLVSNQITDRVLEVVKRLETGKTTVADAPVEIETVAERKSNRIKYFIAGCILAALLLAAGWYFYNKWSNKDGCPTYDTTAKMRVMILPFIKSEDVKKIPEKEIATSLDRLIPDIPGLRGISGVDINTDPTLKDKFISTATALQRGRDCGVEMVVWGKISSEGSPESYTLDVQYQLITPNGVTFSGDTSLTRLMRLEPSGHWRQDVETVARLLCLVMLNQKNKPAPRFLLDSINAIPLVAAAQPVDDPNWPQIDTSTKFNLAYQYTREKQFDKAIMEYDKVLAVYPDNTTALTKRGGLYYNKKDYVSAAQDWGAVPTTKINDPDLKLKHVDALMKSSQFAKARSEVRSFEPQNADEQHWKKTNEAAVQDSIKAAQELLNQKKRRGAVMQSSQLIQEARLNWAVGNTEAAKKSLQNVSKEDPEVSHLLGDIALEKGDTAGAAKNYEISVRRFTAKGIQKSLPPIVVRQRLQKPTAPN
jgi:tetratricopeptide (TPR) repeat protein